MLPELSLNILDISENSVKAGACLITICVTADQAADRLVIVISDDGCGMDEEQLARVTDPFYTTRTTRRVGLGIPFFKYAAECSGGSFQIRSSPGKGTSITAVFGLSHIDRMPLGDMDATIHNLIVYHPDRDFCYTFTCRGHSFTLDTRQMREILEGVPLNAPEVSAYILAYLKENHQEIMGDAVL